MIQIKYWASGLLVRGRQCLAAPCCSSLTATLPTKGSTDTHRQCITVLKMSTTDLEVPNTIFKASG